MGRIHNLSSTWDTISFSRSLTKVSKMKVMFLTLLLGLAWSAQEAPAETEASEVPKFSWCGRRCCFHVCDQGVWAFWSVAEFCLLKFCWQFLHWCSSVILACIFIFCVCFLYLVLVSGRSWPHRMSLEVFLPLQFFESVLEE